MQVSFFFFKYEKTGLQCKTGCYQLPFSLGRGNSYIYVNHEDLDSFRDLHSLV